MLLIPILSVMVCAVGFSVRRKLVYVAGLIGAYGLSASAAIATGFDAKVLAQLSSPTVLPSPISTLYVAWITMLPFVGLLLFVGRTPARLWTRVGAR